MTPIYHTAPNEAPITELFAFLSIDETGEGICAAIMPNLGSTPMVTSKARVAEMMKEMATEITAKTGRPIKLVRFTRAEQVWATGSQ